MSLERIKGKVAFECDGPGCHEGIETGEGDLSEAVQEAKREGWRILKRGNTFKHFCSVECADAHEDADENFGRIKIKK